MTLNNIFKFYKLNPNDFKILSHRADFLKVKNKKNDKVLYLRY